MEFLVRNPILDTRYLLLYVVMSEMMSEVLISEVISVIAPPSFRNLQPIKDKFYFI